MNTYRATSKTAEAVYGDEPFQREDWTAADERDALTSGLIEIVPQAYRVVGDSRVFETAPGETFEAALPLESEKALIDGGHIARADEPPKKAARKQTKREED